MCISDMDLSI